MQDDEETWGNHPDAVRIEGGELRLKHKGKLETVAEREARIQKNLYMKFSRTLDSSSPTIFLDLCKSVDLCIKIFHGVIFQKFAGLSIELGISLSFQ